MSKVVAVHHDIDTNKYNRFQLDDGRVLNLMECQMAIDAGELPDLMVGCARDGSAYVKSKRGRYGYSLDELPKF